MLRMTTTATTVRTEDDFEVCECEIDWTCGLCNQVPWIDRRFAGLDAEEARFFGRYEDL